MLWWPLLFKYFFIKIMPNMCEQEKKKQRIYHWLNTETKPKKISKIIVVSLWPPLSPYLISLDYAIRTVLENKTNATSYPNIGWLKTTIEEQRNKISEEFILKAYKSFRWLADTVIFLKKWRPYWGNVLFCVYFLNLLFIFLKLELIFFL